MDSCLEFCLDWRQSDDYAEFEMDLKVNEVDPDDRPDGVEGSDGEGSASNS